MRIIALAIGLMALPSIAAAQSSLCNASVTGACNQPVTASSVSGGVITNMHSDGTTETLDTGSAAALSKAQSAQTASSTNATDITTIKSASGTVPAITASGLQPGVKFGVFTTTVSGVGGGWTLNYAALACTKTPLLVMPMPVLSAAGTTIVNMTATTNVTPGSVTTTSATGTASQPIGVSVSILSSTPIATVAVAPSGTTVAALVFCQ